MGTDAETDTLVVVDDRKGTISAVTIVTEDTRGPETGTVGLRQGFLAGGGSSADTRGEPEPTDRGEERCD